MTDPIPENLAESTGRRFARRMAAFYASVFIALGVHMPFLPVWFAAKGLDPQTIGVVLALPMILRLVAIPLVTRMADRQDALRLVILAATLAALAGFSALGLVAEPQAIGALYAVSSAFMLLFVLSDVYACAAWRHTGGLTARSGSGDRRPSSQPISRPAICSTSSPPAT
jgi:PPP family 3-phenylpropionic acid transporter